MPDIIAQLASITPIARAAPVPSPSRMSRSNTGVRPMKSRRTLWPGSTERCEGSTYSRADRAQREGGQRRRTGDEPVGDDRDALLGGADDDPGEGGDLETPDCRQNAERHRGR